MTEPFRIITRAEWGAQHPAGFGPAPLPAREVWLHHSVTIAPDLVAPFSDDYAAMRTLERIGQERFGGGVSYTFAVTPAGLIFEGHGVARQGAHTRGRNDFARAIVLVGNYDVARLTARQISAAAWLLAHGRTRGWWQQAKLNGGHQQAPGAMTACPGRYGMAAVSAINVTAARPAVPLHEEDDLTPEQARQLADIHRVLINGTTKESNLNRIFHSLSHGRTPPPDSKPNGTGLDQIAERLTAIEQKLDAQTGGTS